MPEAFESSVKFTDGQVEAMCDSIGDILVRLKTKNVFDLEKEKPIILLDRSMSHIEFRKTELLEVHRFTALVKKHIPALNYLVRNPSFIPLTKEVERDDRIMGAINYKKTTQLRQRELQNRNKVVCLEIIRRQNTPENLLLAQIVFSIAMYCDKYISMEGLVESRDKILPTINNLITIRNCVSQLLSTKWIKDILPEAIGLLHNSHKLFEALLIRIRLNKIPSYYVDIFNLFYQWKYFLWTALSDTEVAKHVLKYHFLTVENKNDLYECWIFCKILDAVSDTYMLKFKEGSRSDGIATFHTSDGSLKITYQKRYGTGWIDEGKWVEDRPDLAIEYKNGYSIILDAKNSDYSRSGPYSYREQMDSYMNSAKATYGILIFSLANPGLWKEIIKNDTQKIIWTHLTPSVGVTIEDTASTANLRKIMDLLKPPTVR